MFLYMSVSCRDFAMDGHGEAACSCSGSQFGSRAGREPLRWSSCGSERNGRPTYCGACGMAMLTDCPICEKLNELEARFCESCGTEMDEVLPGFPLPFAQTCRETFGDMGWWD